jgi:mannose-6-phosphate isomerase-like protein (cupin superfamily)
VTIDTPTTYIYDRRGEGVANLSQWLIVAVAAVAAIFVFGLGRKGPEPSLQPAVFDIVQLASQSQEIEEGFSVAPIAHARTGEVSFAHLEDVSFPMHYHGQSEIAYVLQGEFTLEFADESYRTVGPGELVVIPAGVATSVSGSGDILLFSAPPENERDTVWLEGPRAKRGAKADPTRKPDIISVTDRITGGLDRERAGFRFTVAFESPTGSVELFRIEQGVALHKHPKENHVLYILKGHGKGQIGDQTAEVGPGQIVVIPANVSHKLERIGDEPLDFILFSTPGFHPDDIVWLETPQQTMAMPPAMMAAPTQGFALHIDAKKHINDMPDFVVHHYCKALDKNYIQCLLLDSDRPNARVIGVETIISPEVYAQLPEEERASWHYHKDEIPLVDAQLPGLSEAEAQKVVAAVENTYGRVVIFWVPGSVAPMGTPSVVNPQSHHASAPREIVIKATDFSFEAPEKIEGGLVTVTMENEGAELHHLQLARLRDGVTFDQVHKVLAEGPEDALFELLEWVGGPSLVSPGGQSRVVLTIPEGQYLLLCFVASPDGVPHFAKGMAMPIIVTASSTHAAEPQADLSVVLTDFAFTMPAQIKAGHQVWKVTNRGAQPHEIVIARLMPGKTLQDALRFLQTSEGAPPLEFMGGLQAIDSERTGWAVLDLPLGEYIALCFVPDPASGKAHIELGMVAGFTVK